jgi:hypothetical protein
MVFMSDITERKLAQERVSHDPIKLRAPGELAAGVAHNLKVLARAYSIVTVRPSRIRKTSKSSLFLTNHCLWQQVN